MRIYTVFSNYNDLDERFLPGRKGLCKDNLSILPLTTDLSYRSFGGLGSLWHGIIFNN